MAEPCVSVVIPAYKVARYITETLQSVMEQTYTDYEVIVVDQDRDAAMSRVLEPFAGRVVHVQQEPINVSVARNAGSRRARGRYIASLDGDDRWYPEYLASLVPLAEGGLDVVYPNAVFFGHRDFEGSLFQDHWPSKRPVDLCSILGRESNVFTSALVRRSIFEKVGGYNERLNSSEDLDLWLRIAEAGGRFDFTPKPLVRQRLRSSSLSRGTINMCKTAIEVYTRYLEHADAAVREAAGAAIQRSEAYLSLQASREHILAGDYQTARACLHRAARYYRSNRLRAVEVLLQFVPFVLRWELLRRNTRTSMRARWRAD